MPSTITLHATTVAVQGQGLLIRGASGAGKSRMALALMALGAQLIADDRTVVTARDDQLWLTCPPALYGLIEARGIGLLNADTVATAPLMAVLDLDHTEPDRLPPWRQTTVLGKNVALLQKSDDSYFPAAVLQYLTMGRNG